MKYTTDRPYAYPEKAARRILEIANAVEPIQGRIHTEKINGPFLFRARGSPAEYGAGLKLAIELGWLKMHESGTFIPSHPRAPRISAQTREGPTPGRLLAHRCRLQAKMRLVGQRAYRPRGSRQTASRRQFERMSGG
jgi:hypothetical protein